jgi:hypothetical protein
MRKATRSSGIERLSALRENPRLVSGLTALAAGTVLGLSAALAGPPLPFRTCLFRLVTGWPCPSCGLTHAFIALGHGRWAEGFLENIMSPVLFAATAMIFAGAVVETVSGRFFLRDLWTKWKGKVFIAVIVLASLSWAWNISRAAGRWKIQPQERKAVVLGRGYHRTPLAPAAQVTPGGKSSSAI